MAERLQKSTQIAIRDWSIEDLGVGDAIRSHAPELSQQQYADLLEVVKQAVGRAVRVTETLSCEGTPSDILTAYNAGVAYGEASGRQQGILEGIIIGSEEGYFSAIEQSTTTTRIE